VHAENLLVNECSNGQAVKAIGENFPQLYPMSSLTLIIEAINAINGGAFVISAQKEKVLGKLDLVSEQQTHCFEGHLSTIDIVSKEKIVCIWGETAILKQAEQVIILAVNIPANFDWGFKFEKNGLRDEDFSRSVAKFSNFAFSKRHWFAWFLTSNFKKAINNGLHVKLGHIGLVCIQL